MIEKKLNCYLEELTKTDFKRLKKFGWVKGSHEYGFMNTTKQFDSQTLIGTSPTLVTDDTGYEYMVKYISGCFYPVWRKVIRIGSNPTNIKSHYKLENKIAKSIKPV